MKELISLDTKEKKGHNADAKFHVAFKYARRAVSDSLRVLFKQWQGFAVRQFREVKEPLQLRPQKMQFEISWQCPLSLMGRGNQQFALFYMSEIAEDFITYM